MNRPRLSPVVVTDQTPPHPVDGTDHFLLFVDYSVSLYRICLVD